MPKPRNRLHATYVDRIAIVDRPAVPDAQIVVFKRLKEDGNANSQLLPIAKEDTAWNPAEALIRVKAWAGGDNIDWGKYQKAFMFVDSDNVNKEGSYKFMYADIIDGKLVAIPKAIIAIVGAIAGELSGEVIPREFKTEVLVNCKQYYKEMGKDFPEFSVKSFGDPSILEKDFNSGFCFRAVEAAVDSLQSEVWNVMYDENKTNDEASIKKLFAEFVDVVLMLLAKVTINKQDAENKLTEEDVIKPFARGLEIVAMMEVFAYFKSNIAYMVAYKDNLAEPEAIIKKIIGQFQEFVLGSMKNIVANKRKGDVPVFEKEGRKISTARMAKLKSLVQELSTLIIEAETAINAEKRTEVPDMDMTELIAKMDALTKSVEGLGPRLTLIEGAMKEKGMLLTDAEVAEKAIAEKKKTLAERAKAVGLKEDATEQEVADAEAKAAKEKALEKRAVDAGLPLDSTLEVVEKKEKEVADAIIKSQKDVSDALEKRAEGLGLAKDSTLEVIIKKEGEIAEARLARIEKATSEIGKFVSVVGKRMGVKTSIDAEIVEKSGEGEPDVFGNVLKKK